MMCSVVTCYQENYLDTKSYYMLSSVVACNLELLQAMHVGQCCYYMLCSVVTCYLVLLHVQCCMLPSVVELCC